MREWIQELRVAGRGLRQRPGFAAVAVVTLALGIGANTAIFSFVDSLLFRPMPYPDADRIVRIYALARAEATPGPLSVPEMEELSRSGVFAAVAAFQGSQYNFSGRGDPEEVKATVATRTLFDVLGVKPIVGHVWPEENDRARSFVVMLTHGFWMRKFNGDASVVGRPIVMDGAPYTVAGVLPPGFTYPTSAEVFRCFGIAPTMQTWRNRNSSIIARLRPGTTLAQAQADLDALGRRIALEHADTNTGVRFVMKPLRDAYVGDVEPYLLLLFGAVMLVLVIASVNIANLLLSRQLSRASELAIRAALGASRAQLVRQIVSESLILAGAGTVLGLLFAAAGLSVMRTLVGLSLPTWMVIELDHRVLAFTLVTALATALLCALAPAWRLSSLDLHSDLKQGTRGSSAGHHRLRAALIVAEVALSFVLLTGASVMLQSFLKIQQNRFGLQVDEVLTFRVALPWMTYDKPRMFAFHMRALDALRQLPGVMDAALSSNPPLFGITSTTAPVRLQSDPPDAPARQVILQRVSHNYHRAMGIPLLRGRGFGEEDRFESPAAALISDRARAVLFGDAEPIGRTLNVTPLAAQPTWATVVGIVEDVRSTATAREPGADVYLSARQTALLNAAYLVRTHAGGAPSRETIARTIHGVDANQSVYDFMTLRHRLVDTVWQRRLSAILFAAFALLALVLAAIGLYGVIAFWVGQRTREMGIRQALGASRRDVLLLVIRQGLSLVLLGAAIGAVGALALGRTLASLLFETSARDPLTFLGVPIVLAATATLACLLPALAATRVSPVTALRN